MSKAVAAKKAGVIKAHQKDKNDTGSTEVQVAIFTTRINELSLHLQTHPKDISSRRGLLLMVARRRKLLDYLKSSDNARYSALIEKLNIRR